MVQVEIDAEQIREILIAAGLLQEWDQEDRKAIAGALQEAVELWVARELAKR